MLVSSVPESEDWTTFRTVVEFASNEQDLPVLSTGLFNCDELLHHFPRTISYLTKHTFMDFPAEIRCMIYQCVFFQHPDYSSMTPNCHIYKNEGINLLLVNRKIQLEALPVLFSINTVILNPSPYCKLPRSSCKLLKQITKHARHFEFAGFKGYHVSRGINKTRLTQLMRFEKVDTILIKWSDGHARESLGTGIVGPSEVAHYLKARLEEIDARHEKTIGPGVCISLILKEFPNVKISILEGVRGIPTRFIIRKDNEVGADS